MVEESLFGLLDPEYLLARLNIPQNLDLRHPYCQNMKETYQILWLIQILELFITSITIAFIFGLHPI